MSVSREITYIGISSASHGVIWATNTIRMKACRPRQRIRPTAKAARQATTRASSTPLTATSALLRQNNQKPSAFTAVLKWVNVMFVGRKVGVSAWMSLVGLNAVSTIQ